MKEEKKIRISVYLKAGERAATSYYRFYQYFRQMDVDIKYHLMIPDNKWDTFFPIALQSKWKQVFIFFYIYFRVLLNLLLDVIRRPDCIIISRCILNKFLPFSFKFCIKMLKKNGSKIIWDFDDNIIGSEMTRKSFDWFSGISDTIIVGSPLLKEMIRESDRAKTIILPTTDGDMHNLLTENIRNERINSFESVLKVIWVGTFSTLKYVESVMKAFERVGLSLAKQHKELQLIVICDKGLNYVPTNFKLINIKWNKQIAINQMLHSHVGIMPLEDNESTRGKCGFKLIQYLSVGLPIIGSMVGVNSMIIKNTVGIGVDGLNVNLWESAIEAIVNDSTIWNLYSNNAYKEWEYHYSYDSIILKWKELCGQL